MIAPCDNAEPEVSSFMFLRQWWAPVRRACNGFGCPEEQTGTGRPNGPMLVWVNDTAGLLYILCIETFVQRSVAGCWFVERCLERTWWRFDISMLVFYHSWLFSLRTPPALRNLYIILSSTCLLRSPTNVPHFAEEVATFSENCRWWGHVVAVFEILQRP